MQKKRDRIMHIHTSTHTHIIHNTHHPLKSRIITFFLAIGKQENEKKNKKPNER